MMDWLSGQIAQGLAFNAGSTFDPPHEIHDRRLAPDVSIGVGRMVLNKNSFPAIQTPALQDYHPAGIFPSAVLFPNVAMHLRAGLPGRCDFALRLADMTTPPGYKLSSNATASGQSNSIGLSLRKHFLGGEDEPLLTFGLHYNHVYGRFEYRTGFDIQEQGYSATSVVNGGVFWNVNSYGINAVLSQNYGSWTPFVGTGANYVTGSVRAHLEADTDTFTIAPAIGESSVRPERFSGRAILGFQWNRSWARLFVNGEIKALSVAAGKTWIAQAGISLPFHIGLHRRPRRPATEFSRPAKEQSGGEPEMILLR